jgi:fatty-acyl-CoA synthase
MTLIEAERAGPTGAGKDTALRDWVRALEATAPIAAHPQQLLGDIIEELADKQGDAPALLGSGESLSYAALAARANRYARWALDQNLGNGDTVCLMMPNRPEYMAVWLGLTRVGVVVALINTQLRGLSLAHCIDIVTPKHVIVTADYAAELQGAAGQLMTRPKIWAHGIGDGDGAHERIDDVIERF